MIKILRTVLAVLEEIERQLDNRQCPIPLITSANPDKYILFYWDKEMKYCEMSIFHNGTMEWFYRNRITGELDGTEDPITEISADFLKRLQETAEILTQSS